jgi:phosphate/phosphite/phosphonate ABC transporter binding protein
MPRIASNTSRCRELSGTGIAGSARLAGPTFKENSMRSKWLTLAVTLLAVQVFTAAAAEQPSGKDATPRTLRLGAVCSSPKTVTVFTELRYYLGKHGLPVEYTLYSNYDALGKALVEGQVDIAWNSPLAHGKFTQRAGGSQALVMRDVDVDYQVQLIVRKDAGMAGIKDLAGKTMILGSCDSADATVLPVWFLRKEGVPFDDVKVLSLHDEVDARGCPCHSQEHVLKALLAGRGQAGILARDRWQRLQKNQPEVAAKFQAIWTSPPFGHCVWTARKDFDRDAGARFKQLLCAMDGKDEATREVLELEHCKKWVPGSQDGYAVLLDALRDKQSLPGQARK